MGATPYKVAVKCFIWHNNPEATIGCLVFELSKSKIVSYILYSIKMTLNARISVLVHFYSNSYIESFVFFKVARREAKHILLTPPLNPPLQWSEYLPAIQLVKFIRKMLLYVARSL